MDILARETTTSAAAAASLAMKDKDPKGRGARRPVIVLGTPGAPRALRRAHAASLSTGPAVSPPLPTGLQGRPLPITPDVSPGLGSL